MKKKYVWAVVLICAILVYSAYRAIFVHRTVKVVEVRKGNLVTVVYATGNVTADSSATLRSESGGVVKFLGAREGMHVKRGDVLLRTEESDDLLHLQQARADLESARLDLQNKTQNLQRTRSLFEAKSTTQKSLDDAQHDFDLSKVKLQQTQIALNLAEEQLSKTRVTAPFSGVIISATAKLGDYLLPDGVCFQMIAPSSILVEAQVDEQDFARVEKGQKCVVAFDAYGSRKFDGYVFRIVPETDETTKTSNIFIKLTGQLPNLNVGMTSTVNILTSELHDVVMVPRTAVVQLPNSNLVYQVNSGTIKVIEVNLGTTDGSFWQIVGDNLAPGTEIVSEPGESLKDGMRVEVAE